MADREPRPPEDDFKTEVTPPAHEAENIGVVGRFHVKEQLGEGGMGCVLLAHDPQNDYLVAIKKMKPDLAASEKHRQSFIKEEAVSSLIKRFGSRTDKESTVIYRKVIQDTLSEPQSDVANYRAK